MLFSYFSLFNIHLQSIYSVLILLSCIMQIFIIINLIKLLAWGFIIYLAYNYINLSKDFFLWIFVMWAGIFFFLRWLSFFILFWIMSIFSKNYKQNALAAYKYTGLFAFYILTNFLLLAVNFWNKRIWIAITICFTIIWIII